MARLEEVLDELRTIEEGLRVVSTLAVYEIGEDRHALERIIDACREQAQNSLETLRALLAPEPHAAETKLDKLRAAIKPFVEAGIANGIPEDLDDDCSATYAIREGLFTPTGISIGDYRRVALLAFELRGADLQKEKGNDDLSSTLGTVTEIQARRSACGRSEPTDRDAMADDAVGDDPNGLPVYLGGSSQSVGEPRGAGERKSTGCFDKDGNELFLGDRVRYRLEGSHTKQEYWNPEYEIIWDPPSYKLLHIGGGKDGGNHNSKLKYGGRNGYLELIEHGAVQVSLKPGWLARDTKRAAQRVAQWERGAGDAERKPPRQDALIGEITTMAKQVGAKFRPFCSTCDGTGRTNHVIGGRSCPQQCPGCGGTGYGPSPKPKAEPRQDASAGAKRTVRDIALGCLRRMRETGESHEMCARWISEAISPTVDALTRELADAKETAHMANGVADLAMKHRDEAEAALAQEQLMRAQLTQV